MTDNPLLPIRVSVEHKKEVTQEIPEDVTRARNSAWLDVISPITEWAGLKGDVLRNKRELMRLEQDATLFELSQKLRPRLENKTISPIPTKQLIPMLEKASLEKPGSEFVDRWANLLASAALSPGDDVGICTSILGELGPTEAALLERCRKHLERFGQWTPAKLKERGSAWNEFMTSEYGALEDCFAERSAGSFSESDLQRKLIEFNERSPNVVIGFTYGLHNGEAPVHRFAESSDAQRVASDVLEYRNLVRTDEYWELVEFKATKKRPGTLTIKYMYVTNLAVTFLNRVSSA